MSEPLCPVCKGPIPPPDRPSHARKFCSHSCFHTYKNGLQRTAGGHRGLMKIGYIRLTLPTGERVLEHRWVWEQAHGAIPPHGIIHHVDGNKTNNRLENLTLIQDLSAPAMPSMAGAFEPTTHRDVRLFVAIQGDRIMRSDSVSCVTSNRGAER